MTFSRIFEWVRVIFPAQLTAEGLLIVEERHF